MTADVLCYSPPGALHRLVLLHGWGADVDDLIPLGKDLCLSRDSPIEIMSLRAPGIHSDGYGREWYGLFPPRWEQLPVAVNSLKSRLETISASGIALTKTVLFGFSQGGAMAIDVGSQLPLAGLISCSGYPHPNWEPPVIRPPVLLLHGVQDEIVPYLASQKLLHLLKKKSEVETELISFQGGHCIPPNLTKNIRLKLSDWLT